MSKPTDIEVRATTFVRDNRDLLETAGPLTLQTIARAGSLIAVELCDEVVESAEAYEKALYEGADALKGGPEGSHLSPKRVAAVESRVPTLKATYERKSRAFEELSSLTDAAIARYEARTDNQFNEAWREILDEEPEPASWDIFQKMAESPPRKTPWWRRMFGRSSG